MTNGIAPSVWPPAPYLWIIDISGTPVRLDTKLPAVSIDINRRVGQWVAAPVRRPHAPTENTLRWHVRWRELS